MGSDGRFIPLLLFSSVFVTGIGRLSIAAQGGVHQNSPLSVIRYEGVTSMGLIAKANISSPHSSVVTLVVTPLLNGLRYPGPPAVPQEAVMNASVPHRTVVSQLRNLARYSGSALERTDVIRAPYLPHRAIQRPVRKVTETGDKGHRTVSRLSAKIC